MQLRLAILTWTLLFGMSILFVLLEASLGVSAEATLFADVYGFLTRTALAADTGTFGSTTITLEGSREQ